MAQRGVGSFFLCKRCSGQLLKPARARHRNFSSSPRWAKTIPNFEPTSSEELDNIFLTFREKLFLPWALNAQQRHLIWSPKNREILVTDPGITVEMDDGERVKLQPAEVTEVPNPREHYFKILELMKEPQDWKNLFSLLRGLKIAHSTPTANMMAKLVRKACENGQSAVALRCAEQYDETGLSLSSVDVFDEFILAAHFRAERAAWKGEQMDKALKQAERVIFMLEFDDHKPSLDEGKIDPRRRPEYVGMLLELAAARAVNNLGGVDQEKQVLDYTKKVLALWSNGSFEREKDRHGANKQLMRSSPLWNGLRLSLQVDSIRDGNLAGIVKQQHKELGALLTVTEARVKDMYKGRETRGLAMWRAVHGISPEAARAPPKEASRAQESV